MDAGDRGAERDGVGFVGVAVGEEVVLEELGDFFAGGAEAERDVGRGDALGGDEDVGDDVPVVHGEPFAGAAPAGHDFVGDEEDAVFVADAAEFGHVLVGRDEDAVGADDGLDEDCGYVGLVADHVLDVVGAGDIAAGVGVADGAFVAVDFGGEDDAGAFAAGFHGPSARVSGGGDGADGGAVVGTVARDDLGLAGVHAGDLEGGFVGFGAGGGEEEFAEALGEDFERAWESSARAVVA